MIPRRLSDVAGRDVADLRDALGRVRRRRPAQLLEADRVLADVLLVDPAVLDQLARQRR